MRATCTGIFDHGLAALVFQRKASAAYVLPFPTSIRLKRASKKLWKCPSKKTSNVQSKMHFGHKLRIREELSNSNSALVYGFKTKTALVYGMKRKTALKS